MATLYIVATPIGNLEDITLRALRVLREVALIAAEDTRKTKRLLSNYGISTRLTSYHQHSPSSKLSYLLQFLEKEDVALVSEAGMPGINDPGFQLIAAAIEKGIPAVPLPGPSVVTTALAISGLPTDRFLYVGFLPRRRADRRRLLETVKDEVATLVILEAPHRLHPSLADMLEVLGDRRVAVCRELTKLYEEVWRGPLSGALDHFQKPRGEFTLVIEGAAHSKRPEETAAINIEGELARLAKAGMGAREAVATVAQASGRPKKEVYQTWLQLKASARRSPEARHP